MQRSARHTGVKSRSIDHQVRAVRFGQIESSVGELQSPPPQTLSQSLRLGRVLLDGRVRILILCERKPGDVFTFQRPLAPNDEAAPGAVKTTSRGSR